jgi:hypothetical protein
MEMKAVKMAVKMAMKTTPDPLLRGRNPGSI